MDNEIETQRRYDAKATLRDRRGLITKSTKVKRTRSKRIALTWERGWLGGAML
jgi:hypothetical protein